LSGPHRRVEADPPSQFEHAVQDIFPRATPELTATRKRLAPDKGQAADRRRRGARHPVPYCIRGHTKAAMRHGATLEEVMEAIWVAAEMHAGGANAYSARRDRRLEGQTGRLKR